MKGVLAAFTVAAKWNPSTRLPPYVQRTFRSSAQSVCSEQRCYACCHHIDAMGDSCEV
jgi:hypothetical protein